MFIPSLDRVRRPCRGLEKFFPPVLQRCYSCSSVAQETKNGSRFCFFKSNAPGLKLRFYKHYVDPEGGGGGCLEYQDIGKLHLGVFLLMALFLQIDFSEQLCWCIVSTIVFNISKGCSKPHTRRVAALRKVRRKTTLT